MFLRWNDETAPYKATSPHQYHYYIFMRRVKANTEYWIYIYTNLLPFLLQLDWTVFFLYYRHCHWLQEVLESPREDNVLWDVFCPLQCQHLWHPLLLLWTNCFLFNQIQPLQFAFSLEIEILIAIQSWGVGPLYIYSQYMAPIWSNSLLPLVPFKYVLIVNLTIKYSRCNQSMGC